VPLPQNPYDRAAPVRPCPPLRGPALGIAATRPRSAVVMLGSALLISLLTVPAASASTVPPSITVNLTSGQTVSGSVEVDATITPSPDDPAQSVTFTANGSLSPAASWNGQTVNLKPGQCDTTCTVSWTLDTTQLYPYRTGGSPIPLLPDGTADVSVNVTSAYNSTTVNTQVTVDNDRPTLAVAPDSDTFWNILQGVGDQSIDLSVVPKVSPTAPTGSTISSVELEIPGLPSLPVTDFTPSADGTSWTDSADTSGVSAGEYDGAVVATDSNGVVSAPLPVQLTVDHGFVLSAGPSAIALTPTGLSTQVLSMTFSNGQLCNGYPAHVVPAQVDILLDGQPWFSSPVNPKQVGGYVGEGTTCLFRPTATTPPPLPLASGFHGWACPSLDQISGECC